MNGIQNENWNLTCAPTPSPSFYAPTPSFYADTPLTHGTRIQDCYHNIASYLIRNMNGIQNENWNLTCAPTPSFYAPTPSFYADTPLTHGTRIQEREFESHLCSHSQLLR
jgi:hypothetical protein